MLRVQADGSATGNVRNGLQAWRAWCVSAGVFMVVLKNGEKDSLQTRNIRVPSLSVGECLFVIV